ncbi:hypothetical protein MMC07_009676, partial [Pseudocyphellaria aurata]|nr:hypothetical protein [Pseudocyphellaria aurata]
MANRRFLILFLATVWLISLISLLLTRQQTGRQAFTNAPIHPVIVDSTVLKGGSIAGKIGNETLKAELGRAAWKVLHTTMAKFPDKPTENEKTALSSYLHLFARLYPCSGECASHFLEILSRFPPQVATRSTAAAWACHVHNEVNKSLKKDLFDCSKIGDFYDCGCGDDDDKKVKEDRIDVKVERTGG